MLGKVSGIIAIVLAVPTVIVALTGDHTPAVTYPATLMADTVFQ